MVTEKGLKNFKELYKARYGVELSSDELFQQANNLLSLYKAILKTKLPES